MRVNYYWYHHGLAWCDKDSKEYDDYTLIIQTLEYKQYDEFMELKAEYPDCLPDVACVYEDNKFVEYIDITIPENFMKITYAECECG